MYQIHIDMADIIKIDMDKCFVRVEPYVTIGKLNDFLIGRGWMLPVVPALDDLTIGGYKILHCLSDGFFFQF